ncbi:MAG TPA: outer membrane beta-barrel protein [Thermoanaerobaculia bacterium]|nr:outer membrane beta-barrel protein [Thermoanaerobaculia bacterium]
MKLSFHRLFLTAALAIAAAALPASAQNAPGTWELTPYGGVMFGQQIYQGGQNGRTTIDADNAGTFGARIGYNLNRAFEVEFGYGHTSANLSGTNYPGIGGGEGKIGHLAMDSFELDGLFSWGNPRASGYVLLGAGAMMLDPSVSGVATSSSTRFTWSFGVGGKFGITPNAAFRIEGRFRDTSLSNTTSSGVWCDYYYCYAYSTSWYANGEITGGLTFQFGK